MLFIVSYFFSSGRFDFVPLYCFGKHISIHFILIHIDLIETFLLFFHLVEVDRCSSNYLSSFTEKGSLLFVNENFGY